jgi:hypothetical protein
LLSATGGVYSCGVNNVPTGAEVRLGTVLLAHNSGGPLSPGEWQLSGSAINFKAPAGLGPGQYALRVRSGDVEADPSLWAVVP